MRHLAIVFFLLIISSISFSRTVMDLELKEAVEINEREVVYSLFSPKYHHVNEKDGGHIELDVTEGVEGKEVTGARITLYSKEHRITSFGVSPTIITGKSVLKKILSFPINQKMSLILRFVFGAVAGIIMNFIFSKSLITRQCSAH